MFAPETLRERYTFKQGFPKSEENRKIFELFVFCLFSSKYQSDKWQQAPLIPDVPTGDGDLLMEPGAAGLSRACTNRDWGLKCFPRQL